MPHRNALVLPGMALLAVLWILGPPAAASKVRSVNLEEMTERAATIFSGRVLRVQQVQDPVSDQAVTVATFEVERVVKGDVDRELTIKLYRGGATRPVIEFREGERVVLFLYGASALGLTSPVGLGQGKFSIATGKGGRRLAVNTTGNRDLFGNLTPEANGRLATLLPQDRGTGGLEAGVLLDMAQALLP